MRLSELRHLDEAVVLKAGRPAATLHRAGGEVRLVYRAGYDGPPVATTLPVGPDPVRSPAGSVPPFFAGLLPEGRRLMALRAVIKTSADDELSLLLAVGADTIGDVTVLPSEEQPASEVLEAPSLHEARFAHLLSRALGPTLADRAGLPGVQDKLSSAMISLPLFWGGQPAILKLNPPRYPHLVENEAFFYQVARESGLPGAHAELVHDAVGEPGLLVRRFDRVEDGAGGWRRLAQEDACQVLGRYPADKYRLSSEEVVEGLASVCGAPVVAARDLLRQLVFAYLCCNGDAHAKNFSVLQAPDGEWQVSPLYDIPSSHPYGDHSMALSVNGRDREDITRACYLALGRSVGLPAKAVHRVIDELIGRVPRWIGRLEALPFDPRRVHKLRRAILGRVERLARAGPS